MSSANPTQPNVTSPSIYIISGGAGASGEQLVHTVLVQFPDSEVNVVTIGHVRQMAQLEAVVNEATANRGTIVHTLVDENLRQTLVKLTRTRNVPTIDLMGPLLAHLSTVLEKEPIGHPGLYRQLKRDYFERVAAIDFAMAHDDGKNSQDWPEAEIVLVGLSRVGKTPLSMYLSVLGWKVANIPLVLELPLPAGLFTLDRNRVIGLNIEPGQLLRHRQQRQRRLGAPGPTAYTDPTAVFEEVEAARRIFKKNGFPTIDITDKPIESSADDIIDLIIRRLKNEARRR